VRTITALLTNKAYGYPTRGARRRRKPTILACLHQTANARGEMASLPPHLGLASLHLDVRGERSARCGAGGRTLGWRGRSAQGP
jgi:hypothetical protein